MEQFVPVLCNKIVAETEKIIIGKKDCIRLILTAILAGGHVLLDDLPGVGKTTLIKALSLALGCDYKRIQFVPDLLPSDILGMNIYDHKSGQFQLKPGPIMTNLLVADEINRAIPRTQAALLEAMEEEQITIDGETIKLPKPFAVMATQNPVESESTFKLPAAQMDRFLMRLTIGYPSEPEEQKILQKLGSDIPFHTIEQICDAARLVELQKEIQKVYVAPSVEEYIVKLVNASRCTEHVRIGCSPRGSRGLYRSAKAWAAINGRDFVTPDDIQRIAAPVLAHRLFLSGESRLSGTSADAIILDLVAKIPVPPDKDEFFQREG